MKVLFITPNDCIRVDRICRVVKYDIDYNDEAPYKITYYVDGFNGTSFTEQFQFFDIRDARFAEIVELIRDS